MAKKEEHLVQRTVDFHGLMDILGIYSEDQFRGPWHHGIQVFSTARNPDIVDKYIDVKDNGNGTFTLRADPQVFVHYDKDRERD